MKVDEKRLMVALRLAAKGRRVWVQRVENIVVDGTPDVLLIAPCGRHVWVELKVATRPKRATTPVLGARGMRQEQINWHEKAALMCVETYILIRDDEAELYLIPGELAGSVNKMPLAELQCNSVIRGKGSEFWKMFFDDLEEEC